MEAAVGAGSVQYGRIQHAGVLVKDTHKSKEFYMQVLGMEDDTELRNPKLPFDGAFVRAGSSQIHLMELPNPDPLDGRPEHGGRYVSSSLFLFYVSLENVTPFLPTSPFDLSRAHSAGRLCAASTRGPHWDRSDHAQKHCGCFATNTGVGCADGGAVFFSRMRAGTGTLR